MNKVDRDEVELLATVLDGVGAPDEAHTGEESGGGVAPPSDEAGASAAPGAREEAKPAPDWALTSALGVGRSPLYWEFVARDFERLRKAPAHGESVDSCINTLAYAAAHFDLRTVRAQSAARREKFPHLHGLIEEGLLDPAPSVRAAADVLGDELLKCVGKGQAAQRIAEADKTRDASAQREAETITNARSAGARAASHATPDEDPRWTALRHRHATMSAQARTREASAAALRNTTDEQMSAVRERWASIGCAMTDVITDGTLVGWRADGPHGSYVIEASRATGGRTLWSVHETVDEASGETADQMLWAVHVHGPVLRERWALIAHTARDDADARLHKNVDGDACETPCASAAEEMAELAARLLRAMHDDETQPL